MACRYCAAKLYIKPWNELHTTSNLTYQCSLGVSVEKRVKGTQRRIDLINLLEMLTPHTLSEKGRQIHTMLTCLVEIQHMAYAPESARTERLILRAHTKCFIFGIHYIKLFKNPRKNSPRSMFGMPFHTVVTHLPETLRLISGQSILAENAERHFNSFR